MAPTAIAVDADSTTASPRTSLRQAAPPEELVRQPSRKEVAQAIMAEANGAGLRCEWNKAYHLIDMLQRAVDTIRLGRWNGNKNPMYHIRQRELNALHPVLEVVMPDDVVSPQPGSAHDLSQRLLLEGDEWALVHTVSGDEVRDCTVALHLRSGVN